VKRRRLRQGASAAQFAAIQHVSHYHRTGRWYRAAGNGVTLAALWRRGAFVRRVWRGRANGPNAAHEYRLTDQLFESIWGAPDLVLWARDEAESAAFKRQLLDEVRRVMPALPALLALRSRPHENAEERDGREEAEEREFAYRKDEGLLRQK